MAAQVQKLCIGRAGMGGGETGLLQPGNGVFHKVGIAGVLLQDTAHPLQDLGMQIAGTLAEIGRDTAPHLLAIDQVPLVIHLQHLPHMAGNGQLLPHRRRQHHRPQLLGLTADGIFLTFLEHAVEFKGMDHPLTGKAYHQTTLLRALDVILVNKVAKEAFIILLGHMAKILQCQHPVGQGLGRKLPGAGQDGHGLVVQQAVRQAI